MNPAEPYGSIETLPGRPPNAGTKQLKVEKCRDTGWAAPLDPNRKRTPSLNRGDRAVENQREKANPSKAFRRGRLGPKLMRIRDACTLGT